MHNEEDMDGCNMQMFKFNDNCENDCVISLMMILGLVEILCDNQKYDFHAINEDNVTCTIYVDR